MQSGKTSSRTTQPMRSGWSQGSVCLSHAQTHTRAHTHTHTDARTHTVARRAHADTAAAMQCGKDATHAAANVNSALTVLGLVQTGCILCHILACALHQCSCTLTRPESPCKFTELTSTHAPSRENAVSTVLGLAQARCVLCHVHAKCRTFHIDTSSKTRLEEHAQ